MTLNQTKLVGLTMELELKAREYQQLCTELEELKSHNLDPNDPLYIDLCERFLKNNTEIKAIVSDLKKLKEAASQNNKPKKAQN